MMIVGTSTVKPSENSDKVQQEENHRSTMKNIICGWKRLSKIIVWTHLIYFTFFYLGFIIALSSYLFGLHSVPMKSLTLFWMLSYGNVAIIGATAGAHRMWSHHSFKSRLPLKISVMILYSALGLYSLRLWIKDHRQHHKYTDTDSDPHNASRGLFYSHIGWLLVKRTPESIRTRHEINMSDIYADPVVMFQDKYWIILGIFFCFVLPTAIPVIFWGETILHAVFTQCFLRYVYHLNIIFALNSLGHYWGHRPYNRSLSATDNPILSFLINGEGSHNYHHTFPWDYKGTEFAYIDFNLITLFIRVMASLGLAYDLKEASPGLVKKLKERNSCGNLELNSHSD